MREKITTKEMTLCAMFTVLIAAGAFIKVPVPVVPFTLQFLFTMMAGLLLGGRLGALSVTIYAVLGLVGDKGESCFRSGANAAISGDMLTTAGITVETDMKLLNKLGYEARLCNE